MFFSFFRIKDKINNPPEKQDFQKISHKLADFIKLKEGTKTIKGKLKQQFINEDRPGIYFVITVIMFVFFL